MQNPCSRRQGPISEDEEDYEACSSKEELSLLRIVVAVAIASVFLDAIVVRQTLTELENEAQYATIVVKAGVCS
jgi:hypothetical protein